jgi:ParB family transcriptional regulator, chromosome partitioning protein
MLPIESLIVKSPYLRTNTDIEKLKESIQAVGLIAPLVINNQNELLAGGRRYSALKELGHQQVPVLRVDKNNLEQELISIDENLVRLDLNKIEFEQCLNRGREIYEKLYPKAIKVEEEDVTTAEGQKINNDLPSDQRSFLDITAQKTGLSKKVIKGAIDRDAKSSAKVKELRAHGELNASQTNELIKLDSKIQDEVVELVKNKSAKDVKALVKSIKEKGLEKAVDDVIYAPVLPNEYKSIATLSKRLNKLCAKVLLEEIASSDPEMQKIVKELNVLKNHIEDVIALNSESQDNYHKVSDSEYLEYDSHSMVN